MDAGETIDLLRETAALKGAPEDALSELATSFHERHFESGETIVSEGDPGGEFFLLADGELAVTVPRSGGVAEPAGQIGAGETFGEIATLTGGRRLATIVAATAGRLLVLDGATFQNILHRYPAMAESVLRSLERYQKE